jgi:Zn-dependent peptidase ImmA (M78 family)
LIADLERRIRCADIFDWIECQAESLAEFGANSGAVVVKWSMLRARNILRVVSDQSVARACIVATGDGFEIRINPALPRLARRFALAHELAHTYWFANHREMMPLSPREWRGGRDPVIEYLCDRFAAAFLVPRQRLATSLAAFGATVSDEIPRLDLVSRIARSFDVAEQAVARRLCVDLRRDRIAVVAIRKVSQANMFGSDERWESSWCAVPDDVRATAKDIDYRIPLKSRRRIPNDMVPSDAIWGTSRMELDERWRIGVTPQPQQLARQQVARWSFDRTVSVFAATSRKNLFVGVPLNDGVAFA